jgi:hypothetical protein
MMEYVLMGSEVDFNVNAQGGEYGNALQDA